MQNNVLFFKLDPGSRSAQELQALINNVDSLIASLLSTAMVSVGNGHMIEYEINTGQTTQKVQYSTTKSVLEAIQGYEVLRQFYQNKLSPRVVQLMDSSNFRRPY